MTRLLTPLGNSPQDTRSRYRRSDIPVVVSYERGYKRKGGDSHYAVQHERKEVEVPLGGKA